MKKAISSLFIFFIKGYKYAISPYLNATCRYLPTCSEYGVQAIKKHGPLKGGKLTMKRVCSCHPWGGKGLDPVP